MRVHKGGAQIVFVCISFIMERTKQVTLVKRPRSTPASSSCQALSCTLVPKETDPPNTFENRQIIVERSVKVDLVTPYVVTTLLMSAIE